MLGSRFRRPGGSRRRRLIERDRDDVVERIDGVDADRTVRRRRSPRDDRRRRSARWVDADDPRALSTATFALYRNQRSARQVAGERLAVIRDGSSAVGTAWVFCGFARIRSRRPPEPE